MLLNSKGTWLLILAVSTSCYLAFPQNIRPYDLEMQEKHAEKKGYDSDYRVNYFENIIIRSTLTSDIANLQFRSANNNSVIDLRPETQFLTGVSLDYKWIAVGFSFAPDFLISNEDQEFKNSSSAFRFNLNFFYSDRFRQEFSYSYIQGFNIESNLRIEEIDLNVLRNAELQIFSGSTFFIANKDYSFRAHYAQTERQLKSAGSLIPKIMYIYGRLDPNILTQDTNVQTVSLRSIDIIGEIGYQYTAVFNQKWYATAGAFPGVGYNNTNYTFRQGPKEIFNNATFTFRSEISLGYNNYRWFFGVNANWRNYNNTNNENNQFSRDASYFMTHIGYRFNDNKPMRKFFGWFEDHLGF